MQCEIIVYLTEPHLWRKPSSHCGIISSPDAITFSLTNVIISKLFIRQRRIGAVRQVCFLRYKTFCDFPGRTICTIHSLPNSRDSYSCYRSTLCKPGRAIPRRRERRNHTFLSSAPSNSHLAVSGGVTWWLFFFSFIERVKRASFGNDELSRGFHCLALGKWRESKNPRDILCAEREVSHPADGSLISSIAASEKDNSRGIRREWINRRVNSEFNDCHSGCIVRD